MNIANFISLARLLSTPVVIWAIVDDRMGLAFGLFVAAGVSDAIDGFIAKRFGLQSVLGGFLDPLADKALLMSIYVTLGSQGHLPDWLVILVVSRDVMILGGAMLYHTLTRSLKMEPLLVSKLNTLMQIVLAAYALATLALGVDGMWIREVLTWAVAATTVASGASYLVRWTRRAAVMGDME